MCSKSAPGLLRLDMLDHTYTGRHSGGGRSFCLNHLNFAAVLLWAPFENPSGWNPENLCTQLTLTSWFQSLIFPATHGVSTVSETATLKSHGYQDSQRMSTCHPLLSSCLCRDSQTSSLTSASARWVIFPARPAALPPPQHACVCVCVCESD